MVPAAPERELWRIEWNAPHLYASGGMAIHSRPDAALAAFRKKRCTLEPKLKLTQDQIDLINNKRAIRHGGLKLVLGFIMATYVLAGVQAAVHLQNGLTSLWPYYSAGYLTLVTLAGIIYAFRGIFLASQHGITTSDRWPFKWLVHYFDVNVSGWWLIYACCHEHDHYALALKSSQGAITWLKSFNHTSGKTGACVHTNFLFIPLGGWGKQSFIYNGYESSLLQMPDEHAYKAYQWKIELHYLDPIYEWTHVWLTDIEGSRVRADVWDALVIDHDVKESFGAKWIGKQVPRCLHERDQARRLCIAMFEELNEAERRVSDTRQFVRSRQGLAVRVWLLERLMGYHYELSKMGIRISSREHQDLKVEHYKAAAKLSEMERRVPKRVVTQDDDLPPAA